MPNFYLENLHILDFIMCIRMIVWLSQFNINNFFETKLQLLLALNVFQFPFSTSIPFRVYLDIVYFIEIKKLLLKIL